MELPSDKHIEKCTMEEENSKENEVLQCLSLHIADIDNPLQPVSPVLNTSDNLSTSSQSWRLPNEENIEMHMVDEENGKENDVSHNTDDNIPSSARLRNRTLIINYNDDDESEDECNVSSGSEEDLSASQKRTLISPKVAAQYQDNLNSLTIDGTHLSAQETIKQVYRRTEKHIPS